MNDGFIFAIFSSVGIFILFYFYRAVVSQIRPLSIMVAGWRASINCWRRHRFIVLGIALFVLIGLGLQYFFVSFFGPGVHEEILLVASLAWQAFMATSVAALVVPLHLAVLLDTSHPFLKIGGSSRALLLRAAAYGFGIWCFNYLLGILSRIAMIATPPQFWREASYGLISASFLLTTALLLVRPSLSLGSAQPFRTGLRLALSHPMALCVMTLAMLSWPFMINNLAIFLPAQLLESDGIARTIGVAIISLFSIFQVIAMEAATVIFTRRALRISSLKE